MLELSDPAIFTRKNQPDLIKLAFLRNRETDFLCCVEQPAGLISEGLMINHILLISWQCKAMCACNTLHVVPEGIDESYIQGR